MYFVVDYLSRLAAPLAYTVNVLDVGFSTKFPRVGFVKPFCVLFHKTKNKVIVFHYYHFKTFLLSKGLLC